MLQDDCILWITAAAQDSSKGKVHFLCAATSVSFPSQPVGCSVLPAPLCGMPLGFKLEGKFPDCCEYTWQKRENYPMLMKEDSGYLTPENKTCFIVLDLIVFTGFLLRAPRHTWALFFQPVLHYNNRWKDICLFNEFDVCIYLFISD